MITLRFDGTKSKRSRSFSKSPYGFESGGDKSRSQKARKVYEEIGDQDSPIFGDLPEEILFHVISYTPFGDRFNVALVCRRWRRIADAQVDFFCNLKFVTFAMFDQPQLWSRVMDERGVVVVPPRIMTPKLYVQVARYVEVPSVVVGFIRHPSFGTLADDTIREMVLGAIRADNGLSLKAMLKYRKFREHVVAEAFMLACERYDRHPGKRTCLTTLVNSGAAKMFLSVYQIAQLLIQNGRRLAIQKLSKCEAFYRDPFCCTLYASYALREGYQNLLIDILQKSTLDPGINDNFILKGACTRGWYRVVRLLFSKGVDPSVDNQESLMRASLSNNTKLVKLMLSHNAVRPGYNNNEVVRHAIQHKKDSVASIMIKHWSVDPRMSQSEDDSLLCLAAKFMCYKTMKAVLDHREVDPNQYNHYPARMCVVNRFARGIRLLVKRLDLKLTYDEVSRVLSLANFISDISLRETILKDKRFSDAFEMVIPSSEDDEHDLQEEGYFVVKNDPEATIMAE